MLSPDQMVDNVRSGGVSSRVAKPFLADVTSDDGCLKLTNTISIERKILMVQVMHSKTVKPSRMLAMQNVHF